MMEHATFTISEYFELHIKDNNMLKVNLKVV